MTVSVLCLFLTVPCLGLQCVIVVFPGHSHLLFAEKDRFSYSQQVFHMHTNSLEICFTPLLLTHTFAGE